MLILDASNPLLSTPLFTFFSLFFSSLSSWLVNSRQDITEEIKQNDYLFLLLFSTLFLLFFAVPFCAPFALKRGIKWPCISQEVGVSPWCSFQKVRRAREKDGIEGRQKKGQDETTRSSQFFVLDITFLRSPTDSFLLCICSYRSGSSYFLVLPVVVSLISPSRGDN